MDQKTFTKKMTPHLPLLMSLIALSVLAVGINLPLGGQHDWNSVMYANIAHNHLRYGLLKTKLGMVTNFGQVPPGEPFGYFVHYPPLMPLLITLSFVFFGIHDWSVRLVPILSSTVMVFFLTKLVQKIWNSTTTIIAGILLIFSPMLLYYSKIAVHETIVLGFLAFTLWEYVQWLEKPTQKRYLTLISALVLSELTSWSGFYLAGYLPLHAWITLKKPTLKVKRSLLLLLVTAPVIFALHNLHTYWLIGSEAQRSLAEGMIFRLNFGKTAQMYDITPDKFIRLQAQWIVVYFTRIVAGASLVWVLKTGFFTIKKKSISLADGIIVLLGVFGFTHNLIFRNLAYIHDYMLIYALPFFMLSSAAILFQIYSHVKKRLPFASLIIIMLLFLFATERLPYIKALFHTNQNNPAINLGKSLNTLTQSQDTTIILSTNFMQYLDVFLRYYADRNISAADDIKPKNLGNARYVVVPKANDTLPFVDKAYLYTHFSHTAVSEGVIFDLHSQ